MKNTNVISTKATDNFEKSEVKKQFSKLQKQLFALQNLFYAEAKHSLLIILQGMDSSGKDSTIRHAFYGINPQGCNVKSFKAPTEEEKSHDFLWRIYANLPEKRMIQIFNRSHYEDILYPMVHGLLNKKEIAERQQVINNFENHLQKSNTIILKFYLHISQKEQSKRLAERLTNPEKKWKYDPADIKEAILWDDYMKAYQNVFQGCHDSNPWIIVPADQKWFRNYLFVKTLVEALESLNMKFPQ